ncbi:conserved hypothetical protein [Chlamydia felis Fe/C-56]|uniref:C1q domain-containing protein n=1 Tax=Chlamydia felis (strain Fe/C-56) TaxID=264202 RepID=Q254N2_CHLFF|nr:hypothetical protein [Chlamydia felis]BAE81256.1 conserved hypothetical protein [Chlamydia felis Fe/C-56]
MNKQNKLISSSTPSQPTKQAEEFDATGVKDQNLYMDNATLNIEGGLNIQDEFNADKLTVTNDVNSNCDFFIGGDLTGQSGFSLKETTLNGDITLSPNSNNSLHLNNIADPVAPYDALTFNYYKKSCVQAYTCMIDNRGFVSIRENSNLPLKSFSSKDFENYTQLYRNYFNVDTQYIKIKAPGIYQVTFQTTRYSGQHSGNDEVNLFLRLSSGEQYENLCTADTRGRYPRDRTTISLYSIFSVANISTQENNQPKISVFSSAYMSILFSSISVIWFPFASRFSEED